MSDCAEAMGDHGATNRSEVEEESDAVVRFAVDQRQPQGDDEPHCVVRSVCVWREIEHLVMALTALWLLCQFSFVVSDCNNRRCVVAMAHTFVTPRMKMCAAWSVEMCASHSTKKSSW